MAVYYGVVEHGAVRLPEEAHLPEGTVVEIRQAEGMAADEDLHAREATLYEHLIATGRLLPRAPGPFVPFEPIPADQISGPPLSQIVIEDRR